MKQHKLLHSMFMGHKKTIILFESVKSSGDNCNTMFGGVAHASKHNVVCKTAGFSER